MTRASLAGEKYARAYGRLEYAVSAFLSGEMTKARLREHHVKIEQEVNADVE